jgi:hypothetical protein
MDTVTCSVTIRISLSGSLSTNLSTRDSWSLVVEISILLRRGALKRRSIMTMKASRDEPLTHDEQAMVS